MPIQASFLLNTDVNSKLKDYTQRMSKLNRMLHIISIVTIMGNASKLVIVKGVLLVYCPC